ncbi:MAG: dihydrodipicolinate synthase family protein [Anaerolineales bacterium]
MDTHPLAGVYAAAITPLNPDYTLDPGGLVSLLDFLARRGCHGALLLGTTGEGPSFSSAERREIIRAAQGARRLRTDFRILAGTGTPSLEETIALTREAFDLGCDGVLVLPPYYFRNASEDGLFTWFSEVLRKGVPEDGALLGYHIPGVSGVPLSLDLITRLKDAFPHRFAGLKDSSADPDHARVPGERFGDDLLILNGTDRLLTLALEAGAGGCITALANLTSPDLRRVWDAHLAGKTDAVAQASLNTARDVLEKYPPAAPLLKALLARLHDFPRWAVKPPLTLLGKQTEERAALHWRTRGKVVLGV